MLLFTTAGSDGNARMLSQDAAGEDDEEDD